MTPLYPERASQVALVVKNLSANAGDTGLIPGLGRSAGGGGGTSLQYSCLENPMDRGTWQAINQEVARVGRDSVTESPTTTVEKATNHGLRRLQVARRIK